MNELSCIKPSVLPAARPGWAPSMAPAPPSAVIFSTSRRDAERMILAIPVPHCGRGLLPAPRRYGAAIGEVNGKSGWRDAGTRARLEDPVRQAIQEAEHGGDVVSGQQGKRRKTQ